MIKQNFRLKNHIYGGWIDPDRFAVTGNGEIIDLTAPIKCRFPKGDVELLRGTGIMDIFNKEIFEGDICCMNDSNRRAVMVVYRRNGLFLVKWVALNSDVKTYYIHQDFAINNMMEVIGNRFEYEADRLIMKEFGHVRYAVEEVLADLEDQIDCVSYNASTQVCEFTGHPVGPRRADCQDCDRREER